MSLLLQDPFVDDYVVIAPPHSRLPRLDLGIDWVPRWEEFRTSLRDALTGPKPEGDEPVSGGKELSVEWIRTYRPGSPLFLAILCHAAAIWLITLPIWGFLPKAEDTLAPVQIETDWYVPADLPSILLAAQTPKKPRAKVPANDSPKTDEAQRGADAYHPRQTILSVPVRMTHPRQTLIQPDAPAQPPKVVEQLPNVVQWSPADVQLKRPAIEYSASKSAPQVRQAERRAIAAPQIADARNAGPINIAEPNALHLAPPAPIPSMAAVAPRRTMHQDSTAAPQIADATRNTQPLNVPANDVHLAPPAPVPSNAVAVAPRRSVQRNSAAPEIAAQTSGNPADVRRLISISAAPAPPAPETRIPQGNLAANVSISPDGTKPGSPSGGSGAKTPAASNGNAGPLPAAISVSAASAKSSSGGIARLGSITPNLNLKPMIPADAPRSPASAVRSGPANVATLPPGAVPEKLLSGAIGTLHVSTPNTTSTRGSWILSFSQLGLDPHATDQPKGGLFGPVPIRTVDPKYPPETMTEHISGEVVLYAIIRKDGSVDSIQLVRGIDPRLDKAAIDALAQWRFTPGSRAGAPVDLEAVVHVPFEYRQLNY